jgi:alkylation response protein AidB-like acyl-CoA dehydrogenase
LKQRITECAVSLLGPAALVFGGTVVPTYLNSRAASIYGGSNEIQRNLIARTLLGL